MIKGWKIKLWVMVVRSLLRCLYSHKKLVTFSKQHVRIYIKYPLSIIQIKIAHNSTLQLALVLHTAGSSGEESTDCFRYTRACPVTWKHKGLRTSSATQVVHSKVITSQYVTTWVNVRNYTKHCCGKHRQQRLFHYSYLYVASLYHILPCIYLIYFTVPYTRGVHVLKSPNLLFI